MAEKELAGQLIEALSNLDEVAGAITPDDALAALDEATLQVFWRDWPNLSGWAGALWRRLNEDLAHPARPAQDSDLDEVGGSD